MRYPTSGQSAPYDVTRGMDGNCAQSTKLSDCGLTKPACRIHYVNVKSAAPVAPGATTRLAITIQRPFQAWNMVFPSSIAPFFEWGNLRVGVGPQEVANSGPMLCDTQSEVAFRGILILDPAFAGMDMSLDMTNVDVVAHDAYVQFTGFAVTGT